MLIDKEVETVNLRYLKRSPEKSKMTWIAEVKKDMDDLSLHVELVENQNDGEKT